MNRYLRAFLVILIFVSLSVALVVSIVKGGFNHPCLASHTEIYYTTEYTEKNVFHIVRHTIEVCDRRG